MPAASFVMNDSEVRIGLGELEAGVADYPALLEIAGQLMRASVARTFREEGSPAGSWPRLALSTLAKKGYSGGHKLLILSGRLFNSINYAIDGNTLTVGTGVVYARVQQQGSSDYRGGSIGPLSQANQAAYENEAVKVGAYDSSRIVPFNQRGTISTRNKRGGVTTRTVKAHGAAKKIKTHTKSHTRHQNIPPRPFLTIRPEDPQRIVSGWEAYLAGKAIRIGRVGAA